LGIYLLTLLILGLLWLVSKERLLLSALLAVFALPWLSFGLNLCLRKKLSIGISVSPGATKNSAVACSVRVRNEARLISVQLYVIFMTENMLTGERSRTEIPLAVSPCSTAERKLLLQSSHCGQLKLCSESVYLLDILGFLRLKLPVGETSARVTVLPELFFPCVELNSAVAEGDDNDAYLPRLGNDLGEVLQLRDYVPGDNLRNVHWKLSGKLDRMIVRDGSKPLNRSLLLLWDKTAGAMGGAAADALAETVSSVAQAISEQGLPFILCWNEDGQLAEEAVESPDELLSLLPRLIRDRGGRTEESAISLLLRSAERENLGRILYFAAEATPELEELRSRSRLTAFLCRSGESDGDTVYFDSDSYTETLQNLELRE